LPADRLIVRALKACPERSEGRRLGDWSGGEGRRNDRAL